MVDVWDQDLRGLARQVQMLRRQDGDGTLFYSLGRKGSAIDMDAGEGYEEVAFLDVAGVGRNARNRHVYAAVDVINAIDLFAKLCDCFHVYPPND